MQVKNIPINNCIRLRATMCENVFYDSLEEDNISPRNDHKEKEIDGYSLERKQHEVTSIAHGADATGPVKTYNSDKVPFYNTSVSLTAVRELRKKNNKLKSRRTRVTSIPSMPGNTSNCSLNNLSKKAKENEAKSVVGRWLHNARNPECNKFTKQEFNVNPHQIKNKEDMHSSTMNDIGDKFRSLSCDDHISRCGSIYSSESVSRRLANCNSTPLNASSSSALDSKVKLTIPHVKERSISSGARSKSYLERFYEKRYGPRKLMQRSLLVGSSICSTRGDQSIKSLSSVSNLSQCTRSDATDDRAEEEDYYHRLIEKDIKRRYPQFAKSISETDNSEDTSKSESESIHVTETENRGLNFDDRVQQHGDVESKIYDWAMKNVQHGGKSSSQESETGANNKPLPYVPYNINDYKGLVQPKLGKLGPDLKAVKDKIDRMKKQREYGEIASSRNRELIKKQNQSRNRRKSATPGQSLLPHPVNVNAPFQPPPSAVQTVPRATKIPRKKNPSNNSSTSQGQSKSGGGTEKGHRKDNSSSNEATKPHPSLLEKFKERHLREVQMAEAIRKELT